MLRLHSAKSHCSQSVMQREIHLIKLRNCFQYSNDVKFYLCCVLENVLYNASVFNDFSKFNL